jgi:tocopherol O-methyltransferase
MNAGRMSRDHAISPLECREAMTRLANKENISKFYDVVSSHFNELWGEHLHHGYWIRGDESKERAQIQLIEHLAQYANVQPGCKVLDVGCGMGASSIYLAKRYEAEATGITISPVQVAMANQAAAREGVNVKFHLMDAEAMKFEELFDVVWSVESISHYQDVEKFFAAATKLLPQNGILAAIDWFKRENLNPKEYQQDIIPIEKGMLVELRTMHEYETWMKSNNLRIIKSEILNKNCAKSWDLALGLIKNKSLWKLAAENGAMFVDFLGAFRAIKAGFASGKFVCGLIVAQKDLRESSC